MLNRKSGMLLFNLAIKIPPFLSKLYEIVSGEEHKNIITWNKEGDAFIINDLSSFCDQILPRYFKHSNFASFVRQLNMYDFHKTKNTSAEQSFMHKFFLKNDWESLTLIKRKNYNEALKKNDVSSRKKIDYDTMKRDATSLSKKMEDLKKRVETLEGKHTYLEICHTELVDRNIYLKKQINAVLEQEKQLENLLIIALNYFVPGIAKKNSELKFLSSSHIESKEIASDNSANQVIEFNKSTSQKNDLLNKIKDIRGLFQYYQCVKNSDSEVNEPIKTIGNSSYPNLLPPSGNISNFKYKDTRDMSDFNCKPYDDNYLHYNCQNSIFSSANNLNHNVNSNVTKLYPRRSSVSIIENNIDYDIKTEPHLVDTVQHKEDKSNSLMLNNKRKRSNLIFSDYDKIQADSNYKIENKD